MYYINSTHRVTGSPYRPVAFINALHQNLTRNNMVVLSASLTPGEL